MISASRGWDIVLNLLTACVTLAALLVTGRRLLPRTSVASAPQPARQEQITEWRQYATGPALYGAPGATYTVILFSDFQCPFCRRMAAALDTAAGQFGDSLHVVFRHFPLQNHPAALEAARAAACMAPQERFKSMHDVLFTHADSLGVISWAELARRAGATRLDTFAACMTSDSGMAAVRQDLRAGDSLHIEATPYLLVNGRPITEAISADSLVRMLHHGPRPVASSPT